MTPVLLYTIVPVEVIFGEDGDEEAARARAEELMEIEGVRLLVRMDGNGGAIVARLLSTDPRAFLDPRWMPGNRVRI